MKMKKTFFLLVFLGAFFLITPLGAQEKWGEEASFTKEYLSKLVQTLSPHLKKYYKSSFSFPMRIVTSGELKKILKKELSSHQIFFGADKNKKAVELDLKKQIELYSRILLGKFALASKEMLFLPRNFKVLSSYLKEDMLLERGFVAIIVIHELCHGFDNEICGFYRELVKFTDENQYRAFNAVIEGHAQYVTSKIARSLGLEKYFEYFEKLNSSSIKTGDQMSDYLNQVTVARLTFSYISGRKFFEELEKLKVPNLEKRAFQNPPKSPREILHPKEYLGMVKIKLVSLDEKRMLDHWKKLFQASLGRTSEFNEITLRAALKSMVEGKEVDEALSEFYKGRVFEIPARSLVLVQFKSKRGAEKFLVIEEKVARIKDKKFSHIIKKASYSHPEIFPGVKILLFEKVLEYRGEKITIQGVVFVWNNYIAEVSLTNVSNQKEALDLAKKLWKILEEEGKKSR